MNRFGGSAARATGVLAAAMLLVGAAVSLAPAAGKPLTKKKADARYVNLGERASDADLLDGTDSGAFALESEVMPTVLGGDGSGSTVDADRLDGVDTSTSSAPGSIYVSDGTGDLPADTVDALAMENVTRSILIPAHELDAPFTTGTFPAQTMVGPAPALGFDSVTDETVSFAVSVPTVGIASASLTMRLTWSMATVAGSVRWGFSGRSVGPGEAVDSGGDTFSSAGTGHQAAFTSRGRSTASFSFPALIDPGDTVFVSVFRDADATGDNAAGDAHLHAIEVLYSATQ